jgi:F-type H+-transporting ATPase subunit c
LKVSLANQKVLGNLRATMFIGVGLIEAVPILAIVIAFLILFL